MRKPKPGEKIEMTIAEQNLSQSLTEYQIECANNGNHCSLSLLDFVMKAFALNHGIELDYESGEWAMSDDHRYIHFHNYHDTENCEFKNKAFLA